MKVHFFSIAVSLLIVAVAPAPTFAQTPSGSSTPATNISNDYSYFLKNVDSKQVVTTLETDSGRPLLQIRQQIRQPRAPRLFQPGRWDSEM